MWRGWMKLPFQKSAERETVCMWRRWMKLPFQKSAERETVGNEKNRKT
jgi:hypothetical protein